MFTFLVLTVYINKVWQLVTKGCCFERSSWRIIQIKHTLSLFNPSGRKPALKSRLFSFLLLFSAVPAALYRYSTERGCCFRIRLSGEFFGLLSSGLILLPRKYSPTSTVLFNTSLPDLQYNLHAFFYFVSLFLDLPGSRSSLAFLCRGAFVFIQYTGC